MADQLPLPLDEEPFYLHVHLLTPWGPLEIDRVPVNDAHLDPLDRWKVATGLASSRSARRNGWSRAAG